MAEITIGVDCGNSPKKELLKNYHIALANGDIEVVTMNISDNINWEIIGERTVTSKEEFVKTIQEFKLWKVKELVVDAIITHGTDASVNGRIITADNLYFAFCDVYKFTGSTIKSVKTFLIHEKAS